MLTLVRRAVLTVPVVLTLAAGAPVRAQAIVTPTAIHEEIDRRAADVNAQVIAWRRDLHQHPELGNREVRTSGIVAERTAQARARGAHRRRATPASSACCAAAGPARSSRCAPTWTRCR